MSFLKHATPRPILSRRDPGSPRRILFEFPPAPRSGEDVVTLENVHKGYGARSLYDGLDFQVRRNERAPEYVFRSAISFMPMSTEQQEPLREFLTIQINNLKKEQARVEGE